MIYNKFHQDSPGGCCMYAMSAFLNEFIHALKFKNYKDKYYGMTTQQENSELSQCGADFRIHESLSLNTVVELNWDQMLSWINYIVENTNSDFDYLVCFPLVVNIPGKPHIEQQYTHRVYLVAHVDRIKKQVKELIYIDPKLNFFPYIKLEDIRDYFRRRNLKVYEMHTYTAVDPNYVYLWNVDNMKHLINRKDELDPRNKPNF